MEFLRDVLNIPQRRDRPSFLSPLVLPPLSLFILPPKWLLSRAPLSPSRSPLVAKRAFSRSRMTRGWPSTTRRATNEGPPWFRPTRSVDFGLRREREAWERISGRDVNGRGLDRGWSLKRCTPHEKPTKTRPLRYYALYIMRNVSIICVCQLLPLLLSTSFYFTVLSRGHLGIKYKCAAWYK